MIPQKENKAKKISDRFHAIHLRPGMLEQDKSTYAEELNQLFVEISAVVQSKGGTELADLATMNTYGLILLYQDVSKGLDVLEGLWIRSKYKTGLSNFCKACINNDPARFWRFADSNPDTDGWQWSTLQVFGRPDIQRTLGAKEWKILINFFKTPGDAELRFLGAEFSEFINEMARLTSDPVHAGCIAEALKRAMQSPYFLRSKAGTLLVLIDIASADSETLESVCIRHSSYLGLEREFTDEVREELKNCEDQIDIGGEELATAEESDSLFMHEEW